MKDIDMKYIEGYKDNCVRVFVDDYKKFYDYAEMFNAGVRLHRKYFKHSKSVYVCDPFVGKCAEDVSKRSVKAKDKEYFAIYIVYIYSNCGLRSNLQLNDGNNKYKPEDNMTPRYIKNLLSEKTSFVNNNDKSILYICDICNKEIKCFTKDKEGKLTEL